MGVYYGPFRKQSLKRRKYIIGGGLWGFTAVMSFLTCTVSLCILWWQQKKVMIQAVQHFPLFDALPPVFLSCTQVGWSVWGSLLLLFFFLPSHLLLIFDTVSLYSRGWSLSHSLKQSEYRHESLYQIFGYFSIKTTMDMVVAHPCWPSQHWWGRSKSSRFIWATEILP